MHRTIRVLKDEHAALSVMLSSVLLLLAQCRRTRTLPDFAVLRAMLFYLDEFPEQQHHRMESEILYPKLRARTPLARGVLDRLDYEHARGGSRIRDVEHALLAFEMMGEPRRLAFERAMEAYVDFYLAHMALEEREIMPLAERVLTPQDWSELDAAFDRSRDPLVGHASPDEYEALFTRIVSLLPAPIGPRAPVSGDARRPNA